MKVLRRWPLSLAVGLLTLASSGLAFGFYAAGANAAPPTYNLVNVGAYGGEPSIWSNNSGELYDTTPSGGTILYKSKDQGQTWTQTTTADPNSGDDCVATDQYGSIYECNLAGSPPLHPLEADVWKSTDDGATWKYGNNPINSGGNICGTSCNPFGVDRQWVDAWTYPGRHGTNDATVVLAYHDFYGPSHIWVNVSDPSPGTGGGGGAEFGNPIDVLASPAAGANPAEVALAVADSACSTVPTGVRIARSGAHAGRIYVSWLASDPKSLVSGCNISMVQDFHNLFVAYSDDHGATWTPQLAYDAGQGHDASTPFAAMTVDKNGNPYLGFTTPAPSENPATCGAESTAGTVQTDPSCAYHMWVVWSHDGGATWDGGGGTADGAPDPTGGAAATAYEVDPNHEPQTDVFPAIAAGAPGKVDVGYLRTREIVPTDGLKFDPGGCAGAGPPIGSTFGNPPTYPPTCEWNLVEGQSLNLTKGTSSATWARSIITPVPMHVGDICNLGIACGPTSNRNLLDFISEAVDPTTGYAHIAYPDDNTVNKMRVANQVSGPKILP